MILSPSVSERKKRKRDFDCLGPSGRVVQEKNVLFASSTVNVFADFEHSAHLCTLPLGIARQLFSQKARCQKILARIRLVAKTKATAVPRTYSRRSALY